METEFRQCELTGLFSDCIKTITYTVNNESNTKLNQWVGVGLASSIVNVDCSGLDRIDQAAYDSFDKWLVIVGGQ